MVVYTEENVLSEAVTSNLYINSICDYIGKGETLHKIQRIILLMCEL